MLFYAIEKPNSEEMLSDFQPATKLAALQAKARRMSSKRDSETDDYNMVYLLASQTRYRADVCGQFVYYGGALSWKDGDTV